MVARRNLEIWLVILGSLAAGAAYAWFAGEDINWDWRNYHEYGAFALLNGRFDQDVAPGGFQTFLNPLPYLPAYLLRHHVSAPFWGMWLGALHGLNLALIYWFSRIVLGGAANVWALAASVVIAAFGPMTLSEVGTSFADILTALPVIAGVGVMLSANAQHRARYVIAGMLIGAAAGLKLTNMVFCVGAAISLLYAARPLSALCCFAAGGAVGALGTGGAWAWTLWQEFGNPVFPFYNGIFRSPEAMDGSFADLRFMPHGLWEAFAYPFYWAVGNYRSSEWPFRDPRFAIAFVLLAATVGAGLLSRLRIFTRRDKQFLVFFLVAYVVWLLEFSIHRYAVALELLCAPLIVLLFSRLSGALQRKPFASSRPAWASFATAGLAVAIALWSQPADWSRRPWSDPYQPQPPKALSEAATYLMIEKPLGYMVPLLGPGSRAYQLSDILMPIVPGGSLDHRIRAGLAHPLPGGVWAMHLRGSAPRQCLLDEYGWEIDASRACAVIPGPEGVDIEACPLRPSAQTKSQSC
ncbi:glycosyltransferase family 87 protein [Bradyrhizobium canariense]|nr:glycosyltransferase family 87 protein [Bradyrhizobium canariense]